MIHRKAMTVKRQLLKEQNRNVRKFNKHLNIEVLVVSDVIESAILT